MQRFKRSTLAMIGVALVVLFAAACGSSSKQHEREQRKQ